MCKEIQVICRGPYIRSEVVIALWHSHSRVLKCWNCGSFITRIFMEACFLFPAYDSAIASIVLTVISLQLGLWGHPDHLRPTHESRCWKKWAVSLERPLSVVSETGGAPRWVETGIKPPTSIIIKHLFLQLFPFLVLRSWVTSPDHVTSQLLCQ